MQKRESSLTRFRGTFLSALKFNNRNRFLILTTTSKITHATLRKKMIVYHSDLHTILKILLKLKNQNSFLVLRCNQNLGNKIIALQPLFYANLVIIVIYFKLIKNYNIH